jgi:acetyl-CoA carboxylase biotin carboxyl carrier protein
MNKQNKTKKLSLPESKELETYCDLMNEKKIAELEIETNEIKLRFVAQNSKNTFQNQPIEIVNNDDHVSTENRKSISTKINNEYTDGEVIKSPMVGTAYLSPEPKANSFVKKGDKVKKGQTLLIIEAMKVMNNINIPRDGIIEDVLVEDSQPVEYDQPLVIIK